MVGFGKSVINGKNYTETDLKSFAGYVMQDDLVNTRFTIYEILFFTAALRLSGSLSLEEQKQRIDEVIDHLHLRKAIHTKVGDSRVKGISGGERKRLCVAVELLIKPKLLFLDEPTTGLDSANALTLIESLRELTDRNECVVVLTVHQPTTKMFELFRHIILLRNGASVFQGHREDAIAFFLKQNFVLPLDENPAGEPFSSLFISLHLPC